MKSLILIIIIILSAGLLKSQDELTEPQPLNLTTISIDNQIAIKIYQNDKINVRDPNTTYLPVGEIPVLRVESPDPGKCIEIIGQILTINDKQPRKLKEMGDIYCYQLDEASVWIHTYSGGFKYTKTANKECSPTRIEDAKEAVEIGLAFIAENNLIKLGPEEELDIITVSKVHNALSNVEKPEAPIEHFVSDYYVSFGHRYRGIPIIGSHITLRVNPSGNIAMINKNWRQITKAEETVKLNEEPLRIQIYNSPEFQETYDGQNYIPDDIHISYIRAGYIEAPFDFKQQQIRPGALVTFWVGEERGEMDNELLIPLEKDFDPTKLLGVQAK